MAIRLNWYACLQKEATDVFFSVTKLYQSKDANLRRMVFLVIKEVSKCCPAFLLHCRQSQP